MDNNDAHNYITERIYAALLNLTKEKPFKEITITDITKKANISRMTFYRYYTCKEDILLDHLAKVVEKYNLDSSIGQNFYNEDTWRELVDLMKKSSFMELYLKAGLIKHFSPILRKYLINTYKNIFHKDVENDEVLLSVDMHMGALFGIIRFLHDNNWDVDTDLIVKSIMSLEKAD